MNGSVPAVNERMQEVAEAFEGEEDMWSVFNFYDEHEHLNLKQVLEDLWLDADDALRR